MAKSLLELPMIGPYKLIVRGTTTTINSADLLSDHNTATLIEIQQWVGLSGVLSNRVSGSLGRPPAGTVLDTSAPVVVYARISGGAIANVRLNTPGAGSSANLDPSKPPIETELGTLYPMESSALGQVRNALNGYGVTMTVSAQFTRVETEAVTIVSEAWIVVRTISPAIAPPCRLTSRGDVFDPGGARLYPPSKMQQTSIRGVGAY